MDWWPGRFKVVFAPRTMPSLGLYVHVPFCSAICNYCNFNRGLFDESLKRRYVEALLQEIDRAAASQDLTDLEFADTLYFGGGTPSLLEPEEIGKVVALCRRA